jgi:pSer/pThr/pTyr-binding forkhead associated (FHA) protein
VLLRGGEVLIRDLNSTNGTFINNAQITESVLKPGQTLRLGQIELKLEGEGSVPVAAAPAAAPAPAPVPAAPPKKPAEATLVIPRGVSLSELEGGGRKPGLDSSSKVFSKKRNKSGLYFWIGAGVGIVVIIVLILFALKMAGNGGH